MRKKLVEALMDFINFISASVLSGVDELNRELSSLHLSADKLSRDPLWESWEWLSECLTRDSATRNPENMRGVLSTASVGPVSSAE